ncbi:hypothetical protein OIV83_000561 [Microbotryomycetes sp. JL201]|nr:hypothetical protein OIV83_000561 [Microbotryomycetes sp. JL201]
MTDAEPCPPPPEDASKGRDASKAKPHGLAGNSLAPRDANAAPASPAELEAILNSAPAVPIQVRPPKSTPERPDERCWTTTRQTNARRALGRPPQTTMYCYINWRHAISDLIPVPGMPGAFIARESRKPTTTSGKHDHSMRTTGPPSSSAPVSLPDNLPAYHWPWLDGRYLYIARGSTAVKRHLDDMHGAHDGKHTTKSIDRLYDRCVKQRIERDNNRKQTKQRQLLGIDDPASEDYERLISLSSAYSTSLQRMHAHIQRIYGPAFRNLGRLPETFTDGTQKRMLDSCIEKLTDGSAFKLVDRLWDSTKRVTTTLYERKKNRDESDKGKGDGGAGPPVIGSGGPVLPPLPPPPAGGAPAI